MSETRDRPPSSAATNASPEYLRRWVVGWSRLPPAALIHELRHDFAPAVIVLATGDLISNFGFALVFPFLTLYLTGSLRTSAFTAGALLAAYGGCRVVSNAAGGWLADRIGRKRVMVASVSLTALVLAGLGQTSDLRVTASLLLLLGLVDPAFTPAARAAITDVVPDVQQPRAFALLAVAQNVGWIVGPAAGAGLAAVGYPVLFPVAATAVASYAVFLVLRMPETMPAARRRGIVSPSPTAKERRVAAPIGREGFLVFLLLVLVFYVAEDQWFLTLPIYGAKHLGLTIESWGVIFAVNGLLIVLLQLRITGAIARQNRLHVVALGAMTYAVAYALVAFIPDAQAALPLLGATMVMITLGEILLDPMIATLAATFAAPGRQGQYQGLVGAAVASGAVIGPVLGGWTLDNVTGSWVWLAAAADCTLAAAGFIALARWRRRRGATA